MTGELNDREGRSVSATMTHRAGQSVDVPVIPRSANRKGRVRVSFDLGQVEDLKVLIAEDDENSGNTLHQLFVDNGYKNVVLTRSGADALDKIQKEEFHVLLLDVHLRDINGIDLLTEIRLHNENIAIIMTSTAESARIVFRCLEEGADDYLLKPVHSSAIKNAWANVWKRKREKIILRSIDAGLSETAEKNRQLESLTNQVSALTEQVNHVLVTPITVISQKVSELVKNNEGKIQPDVSEVLSSIIKTLHNEDLYKPVFSQLLQQSPACLGQGDSNERTRRWLLQELGLDANDDVAEPTFAPSDEDRADSPRHEIALPSTPACSDPSCCSSVPSLPLGSSPESSESSQPNELSLSANNNPKDCPPLTPRGGGGGGGGGEWDGLISQIRQWDMDIWAVAEDQLSDLVEAMFQDLGLLDYYQIDRCALRWFLGRVRNSYRTDVPYHNFRHAIDVTHAVYWFLRVGNGMQLLAYIEVYALMIASLCHDLGHPGLNNGFLVQTSDPLAMRYNDISVLENFHSCLSFEILTHPDCRIPRVKEIRQLIIHCIMTTDPSKSITMTEKIQNILPEFNRENPAHRQCLMATLIRCADISNPARAFPVCRTWAEMIQEEFFCQGDREKELGMECSPFMDRDSSNLPQMQVGFIDFFVSPIFSMLAKLLPNTQVCIETVLLNRKMWKLMEDN